MSISLPPSVRATIGRNGLASVAVRHEAATAEIYLHGGHVTAWQPASHRPVLWMSAESHFAPDKPIRGGVPICFPWFGAHATDAAAPAHGFARLREWELAGADEVGDAVQLSFRLRDNERSRSSAWPYAFAAEYRVTVGRKLGLALDVVNSGTVPFRFEAALHTYFALSDVREASLTGLESTEYLDKVADFARKREGTAPIRFTAETDRVYLETDSECVIHDPGWARQISIAKTGSQSTVVWNPWIAKARAMPDFGDDEWPGMLCIETANVGEAAVTLEPGSHHRTTALIAVGTT